MEITYPHNWFNVTTEDGMLEIQPEPGRLSEQGTRGNAYLTYIEAGYYERPDELIKAIGKKLIMPRTSSKKRAKLSYSSVTQKATVYLTPNTSLTLSGVMEQILGFPTKVIKSPAGSYSFKPFEGSSVVDMNQDMKALYVYSSVVQPRIVGKSFVSLLRIVPIAGKHGEVVSKQFDNIHYVPLLTREFGTIEVEIRDDTGRSVPFERGKVTVTLHFRRRKNSLFRRMNYDYYTRQVGGALPYFVGSKVQRGHGLGSLFGGLLRSVAPLIRRGAVAVRKRALKAGMQIADDVMAGQNIKQAAKRRVTDAGKDLMRSLLATAGPPGLRAQPKRRKRHIKCATTTRPTSVAKRRRKEHTPRDVFDA